jgi:hypothetical protein
VITIRWRRVIKIMFLYSNKTNVSETKVEVSELKVKQKVAAAELEKVEVTEPICL